MSVSAELKREREVQGYAQSWKAAQGSSLNVALNVDSIELYELRGNGYTPRASRDKALTAFAQLAVLRLDVMRGMISLIDKTAQHVLAEATRNLRLVDLDGQSDHSPRVPNVSTNSSPSVKSSAIAHNDLWLGASIVSRCDTICEYALTNTCTAKDPDSERTYTAPGLIVPNCQDDPRFCNRPYVRSEPGIRFYAAVPIVSRNGHKIGVYSVSDEKPRHGLTIDELQFMQGAAQAVMEHLEWARDRVDRFKGERIVRGLAAFIEGCSALCDEPKDQAPKSPSTVRPPEMSLVAARRPHMNRTSSQFRGNVVKLKEIDKGRRASSAGLPQEDTATQSTPSSPEKEKTLPQRKKTTAKAKADGLSRMFHRASEILRQATLADGVILFGATTTDSKEMLRALRSGGHRSDDDDDDACSTTQCNTSGSENGVGLDSSDSDTSPLARPCKIFSYSLADEKARADIEQGTALSLGALEKYFSLFPRGKTFSFTEEGMGLSSEDDSASDREPPPTPDENGEQKNGYSRPSRKAKMDHRELLKKIPGAKSVVFVPLYDYADDRLYGGCFLWTSVNGRIMNLDADLSYLRAFSNAIMSSVGRINTQKNEAAKTTFIASISHELRSPLHGILGAAEFLKDTSSDPYQTGLIDSISICGKTLLDTLNHVLDYSKINRLGALQMRRGVRQNKLINLNPDSLESMNMTAVVDLGVVLEEVVDAISAGHTFKLPGTTLPGTTSNQGTANSFLPAGPSTPGSEGSVSILLDIDPKISWMVRTQPGAIRRIIMNLFGNALKYTSTGYVLVSLRGQPNADKSKINALVRIEDTGKGMSEEFKRNRLFVPFSQEDSFQPGTGLGLSIVKQIVDSLRGNLEVKSEQYKGTEVDVRLRFTPGSSGDQALLDETMRTTAGRTQGKQVVLLQEEQSLETQGNPPTCQKLTDVLAATCMNWFGMKVAHEGSPDAADPDIFVYCEPPPFDILIRRFQNLLKTSPSKKIPIVILVCPNAEQAVRVKQCKGKGLSSLPIIVEVIPQPCGPRKLGRVLSHCLDMAEKMAANPPSAELRLPASQVPDSLTPEAKNITTPITTVLPISPPPINPETPSLTAEVATPPPPQPPLAPAPGNKLHVLLVDDNKINLQLLVMFMKKCKFTYEGAENGQEALDKFKGGCLNGPRGAAGARRFDFVLMDISMPVMNGIEATKHIRAFERENKLPRTNIIALTGLASADTRREADSAGVDIYLPKPVKFAELKSLLSTG